MLAAAEEIRPRFTDHWEDVTTAMHDADARHLYVDVAEPLAGRAVLSVRGASDDDDVEAFRAQSATSAARSIGEARVAKRFGPAIARRGPDLLQTDEVRLLARDGGHLRWEDTDPAGHVEAYVQNQTPGAYRVFFYYGPDRIEAGRRIAVLTIVDITPHP